LTTFRARLAYQFKDPALLDQALRHRSAGKPNNERLEFLGDSVLGFLVSDLLYRQFPAANEGELSRIRALLVQRSMLAEIARQLHLGEELKLGSGELKSGGAQRESILADAMEALVSALYLDGGLDLCREKLQLWLGDKLSTFTSLDHSKDAKTRLQEWLQARRKPLPAYHVVSITGSDHQQLFTVSCSVTLLSHAVTSQGSSRKEAEQLAAALVLRQLEPARE
jgi:ribonuclease III